MTNYPHPWEFALLSLAAYRTTRGIGWDTLTEPLRRLVTRLGDWSEGDLPAGYRRGLDEWLHCPWCLGAHVSIGWWVGWWYWPDVTVALAVPFAISAVVGLVARNLDP